MRKSRFFAFWRQDPRWRISAILDFRRPIMGSLKSPCATSCRLPEDVVLTCKRNVYLFCYIVLKFARWGRLISVPLISSTDFFMKLLQTNNMDIIKSCQSYFSFQLPSAVLSKRVAKFNMKFKGALKMQDKTLQDRTMTDKRSTMPE